jgi:hypothetical protein
MKEVVFKGADVFGLSTDPEYYDIVWKRDIVVNEHACLKDEQVTPYMLAVRKDGAILAAYDDTDYHSGWHVVGYFEEVERQSEIEL